MRLVAFNCPSCGAHLDVDVDNKTASCQFCGAIFPVEDETQHIKMDGAAQAGYEFEKGRQRAQAEAAAAAQQLQYAPLPQYVPAPEPPKKRKTWLWVLGWICIFPVPLTLIMLKKKDMNPKVRYGIIAAGWLVYLVIGLSGRGKRSENKITDTSSETVATQEAEPAEEAQPAETQAADVITLTAGQTNEYSQTRTWNAGTELEETQLVYYVPAGKYEVENIGGYRAQVNVYEGMKVNEDGWEEPANIAEGTPLVLDKGQTGTITVPDGYYIDIIEPDTITLTPIA